MEGGEGGSSGRVKYKGEVRVERAGEVQVQGWRGRVKCEGEV